MSGEPPPDWRLPNGVDAPLWRYANTPRLATEEDEYFEGHPLFRADAEALDARFVEPGRLIDLGCGAGRHSIRFAHRGFPVVAVDLSASMLGKVADKARRANLKVDCLQANLCRLGCLEARSFRYALSMFSTLGMIRTSVARRAALSEAFRVLEPGGRMALHAHNVWLNLGNPQGRSWLLGQALRRNGSGDRQMTYRGIAGMKVHLFTWRELAGDIRSVGLKVDEVLAIDAVRAEPIAAPWLLGGIRAGGWIVFLRRP